MENKLAVYVHIPFCVRKCAYCDFLSAPAKEEVRKEYVRALAKEISFAAREGVLSGYEVCSVFFGGGTPSVLEAEAPGRILEQLRETILFDGKAEITIECNPGTLTREKLAVYRRAGINRISIGLQSADNRELALLGRIHTWEDFLCSYELVREAGFDNVNIDLISALPGQTAASWEKTLEKAARLQPEHISAYSLILEEGTPFYERYGKQDCKSLPDEDTERSMYARTGEILGAAGYQHYEISNYSLPDKACRHNICYWNRTPYVGFGLGAASLLDGCRFSNERDLERYLERAGQEDIRKEMVKLSRKEEMEEFMFLGLRMMCGVSKDEFFRRFKRTMEEVYGEVLKKHISLGMLNEQDGRVYLTDQGIYVSNAVFCDFLLDEE